MKTVQWLTVLIAALATIACAGGLLIPNLYRDSELIQAAWFGNDVVTLFIIPVLILSVYYYKNKGQYQARLVWLGLMLYLFYNYAFYLFGARFNAFFLIYAALFSLSLYALLLGLLEVNASLVFQKSVQHRKIIALFLVLIAIPLAIIEIGQCLNFIVSGTEPQIPPLIFALDLSLVLPNSILAAILLWKKRDWGVTLSAMMLVKAMTYGTVLLLGTILIGMPGVGPWDPLLPFYAFVATGGCFFGWLLFRDLKNAI